MHKFSRVFKSPHSFKVVPALIFATLWGLLFLTCKSKTKSLPEQLKNNLEARLQKADSTVTLDSFIVLRMDTIDRRVERIIDDSLYMREFVRVQSQLRNAIKEAKRDSIAFYQDEVNYMLTQVDSLNKEISIADTTSKLGLVVACKIELGKNNRKQEEILYIFLDRSMTIRNSEMIDSTVSGMTRRLN